MILAAVCLLIFTATFCSVLLYGHHRILNKDRRYHGMREETFREYLRVK